jgi:hypothetical protein
MGSTLMRNDAPSSTRLRGSAPGAVDALATKDRAHQGSGLLRGAGSRSPGSDDVVRQHRHMTTPAEGGKSEAVRVRKKEMRW